MLSNYFTESKCLSTPFKKTRQVKHITANFNYQMKISELLRYERLNTSVLNEYWAKAFICVGHEFTFYSLYFLIIHSVIYL